MTDEGFKKDAARQKGSSPQESSGTQESSRPQTGRLLNRYAVLESCPYCTGRLTTEHAHYRCRQCGWRDSCCD